MSEYEKMNQKIDSVIHKLMKEQLTNLPDYSTEENNSFAYLEKSTLNLLIAYLISGEKRKAEEIGDEELELNIIKQLDEMLEESKEQFEEVISLLKKFS
ncbi:hypothetical protein FJQ98_24470 [Lysinibacillus agricola]|uniref:Uncharacterized protein n=1 Tax=Lysinibacillus agricola TaxID=2590012 RepID=A0ABX7ATH5_9BACI|nr:MULTISPECIES: hypothetical protein [Lysinibacillus]KOS63219.1 hypothetical protein AN161_08340 [Lysinibacillus sp. FJAT-14222]QQP12213.1 hypothetical protein FJQ98_24470 [Lysinibacillus agricola]